MRMTFKKSGLLLFTLLLFLFSGCSSTPPINRREKISKYFTMGEAVNSSIAKRRGIANVPNGREQMNIRYTAQRLDEVRRILGRPVIVTSWYRSRQLNRAVGGSRTSAHREGLAADIMLKKGRLGRLEFEKVRKRMSSYDQLIYYPYRGHLHVGFRRNRFKDRREAMIKR